MKINGGILHMGRNGLNLTLAALVIITVNLKIISWSVGGSPNAIVPLFASLAGLVGLVLLSASMVMSTKIPILEDFFGGASQVNSYHRRIGTTALLLILNHPILFVVSALQKAPGMATLYIFPGSNLAYNLGIYAVYIMIISVFFMAFTRLPYHLWKMTHKLLGVVFILGGAHSILIQSGPTVQLRIWTGVFVSIGTAAAIYSLFLRKLSGSKYQYTVKSIERKGDVLNIFLKSSYGSKIAFKPGQFVNVEFDNKVTGRESHPFSISSSPEEEIIRISAKIVGDYTVNLLALREGDRTILYGPHGNFGFGSEMGNSVWIAGGIGITPFLNFLKYEVKTRSFSSIAFYNCFGNKEESVFEDEISESSRKLSHLRYFSWPSNIFGRLTAEKIAVKTPLPEIDSVLFCGPAGMAKSLRRQFISMGLAEDKFHWENFDTLNA